MKLFIIRHAQSANNVIETEDYDYYMRHRVVDPSITELGVRQTAYLAQHLALDDHAEALYERAPVGSKGYHFTHLFCSPMLRTLQTTLPISQTLGLPPTIWVDIHEQGGMFVGNPRTGDGFVVYGGMTRSEINTQFPGFQLPAEVDETGWWRGSYEDLDGCDVRARRVAASLRGMAEEMPDARIALVTHGTFTDRLLKALGDFPFDGPSQFHTYNTAISRISFRRNGTLSFSYVNRVQHLPPDLVSL